MSQGIRGLFDGILGPCECGRSLQLQDCYLSEDGGVEQTDSLVSLQASADEEDDEAAAYNQDQRLCVLSLDCCCTGTGLVWQLPRRRFGCKSGAALVTCLFEGLLGADTAAADALNSSPAAARMQSSSRVKCLVKFMRWSTREVAASSRT